MKSGKLEKINRLINEWANQNRKVVVAIDGYTGVGKTTLLKNLARLNRNILRVNRDDFLIARSKAENLLKKAADKSKVFETKINDNTKLKSLVQAFKKGGGTYKTKLFNPKSGKIDISKTYDLTKRIMIVEGVFMFHPKLLNNLWDRRIYMKGNKREIDQRRIAREKKRWGKNYFPETHPDSHFRQVIIALKRYEKLYKPTKSADLVIEVDLGKTRHKTRA